MWNCVGIPLVNLFFVVGCSYELCQGKSEGFSVCHANVGFLMKVVVYVSLYKVSYTQMKMGLLKIRQARILTYTF